MNLLEWRFIQEGYTKIGHNTYLLHIKPKVTLAIIDKAKNEVTIVVEYRGGPNGNLSRDRYEGPAWERFWPNGQTKDREFWENGQFVGVERYNEAGHRLE